MQLILIDLIFYTLILSVKLGQQVLLALFTYAVQLSRLLLQLRQRIRMLHSVVLRLELVAVVQMLNLRSVLLPDLLIVLYQCVIAIIPCLFYMWLAKTTVEPLKFV